jgi:epoxyqueuosine reductase
MEWKWILEPGEWAGSRSLLICCLSCHRDEPDNPSLPGDPHGLIAPFARAHYYRTAVDMLKRVRGELEQRLDIPRSSIRLFSNSRIPEKPLLAAAGVGSYGKNGCIIVPGLGSQLVIAGAVIPAVLARGDHPVGPFADDPCGSCSRCVTACPTGALGEPHVPQPHRCLQALAGSTRPFPDDAWEAWGTRLYGCQDCQAACPHNRGLRVPAPRSAGEIGPGISLRRFLGMSWSERRSFLRGTALGVSWIPEDALLRNALVAAGNSRDQSLRRAVEAHGASDSPLVRQAAAWALKKLGSGADAPTCGCCS